MVEMGDGGLIAAGYVSQGDGRIEGWEAMTVRVDVHGAVHPSAHGPGWIAAVAGRGEQAVAVRGQYHPANQSRSFEVMESKDAGRSWGPPRSLEALSVERLAFGADGVVWLLGAQTLLRRDAGAQTWVGVDFPGHLRGIHQPICMDGEGRVLIGGQGLYRSSDLGAHWEKLAEEEVVGCDGRWLVARVKPGFRVGELQSSGISWGHRVEAEVLPTGIMGSSDRWVVRSEPLGRGAGAAIWLYVGERGASEPRLERLSGGSDSARLGLGNHLWWMRQDRGLRRASLNTRP